MPLDLLLTAHERGALESACQRGFWLPVAIPQVDVLDLAYLVVLHPQAEAVAEVAPINSHPADGGRRIPGARGTQTARGQ